MNMDKKGLQKKGVSPVVATVLLIVMVIVIALIIFLWFKGIGGEVIMKFDKNVELVCGDVQFYSEYNSGQLSVSNTGNVPIFGMKVKVENGGEYQTWDIREISSDWPDKGLNQGGTFSANIGGELGSSGTLVLTPVLLGTSDKGERAYMCNEAYSYQMEIY